MLFCGESMSRLNKSIEFLFKLDYKLLLILFSIVKLMTGDGPPEHL